MPEKPGGTEITELAALKALAQPRRQHILQHLTLYGPATSAILARALGLNTGATSYHLRELARYGFVADTTPQAQAQAQAQASRGGRARWWRAVPGDRRFPPPSRRTPGMRLVMEELNRHAYAADLALFERLQRESAAAGDGAAGSGVAGDGAAGHGAARGGTAGDGSGPDEWADAHAYSRGSLRLTLPELQQFFEEYIGLMNRYKRPEAETPPGARTVHTRLLVFPGPGEDTPAADGSATDDTHRRETDAS
ncbi:ArsR/SmtB family transcription factor [Streptomyces sp. OR43]|uniref:ArsR/SmtB family transcription factor n=1 Tax=Streptomyces sp. or43 TaxID=2478957 RepID=UPI0011CD94B2|nr:helix-turn-helix domain-containing protein [Streptomyces sp. or43]TXS38660.1 ArsR family transcriptional regulator [Streptomyces sp. or43]